MIGVLAVKAPEFIVPVMRASISAEPQHTISRNYYPTQALPGLKKIEVEIGFSGTVLEILNRKFTVQQPYEPGDFMPDKFKVMLCTWRISGGEIKEMSIYDLNLIDVRARIEDRSFMLDGQEAFYREDPSTIELSAWFDKITPGDKDWFRLQIMFSKEMVRWLPKEVKIR